MSQHLPLPVLTFNESIPFPARRISTLDFFYRGIDLPDHGKRKGPQKLEQGCPLKVGMDRSSCYPDIEHVRRAGYPERPLPAPFMLNTLRISVAQA